MTMAIMPPLVLYPWPGHSRRVENVAAAIYDCCLFPAPSLCLPPDASMRPMMAAPVCYHADAAMNDTGAARVLMSMRGDVAPSETEADEELAFRYNIARRKRKRQCSRCSTRSDCGVCAACLDKPKFGGGGTRKQGCFGKRCACPFF